MGHCLLTLIIGHRQMTSFICRNTDGNIPKNSMLVMASGNRVK